MKHFRHGDVVLEKIDTLPKTTKIDERPIAYGEISGHSHRVQVADPQHLNFYQDSEGRIYFKVESEAKVVHQEHDTITLEPGIYKTEIKREFDYLTKTIDRVRD